MFYCHPVHTGNITTTTNISYLLSSWLTQGLEKEGEFLALKLVSGQYAYSMEATCPKGKVLWKSLCSSASNSQHNLTTNRLIMCVVWPVQKHSWQ